MTSRRLFLVFLLVGLGGLALALATTRPFERRQPESTVTLRTVGTSGAGAVAPERRSDPVSGAIDAQTFRRIAEAQMPMVVNIRSEARRQTEALGDFFGGDDPFRRFFGLPEMKPGPPRDELLEGAGSGFIIDKSGLILTNNHVIAGASRIEVGLFPRPGQNDRQTYQAKVIGRDPLTDSALIRIVETLAFDLPTATDGAPAVRVRLRHSAGNPVLGRLCSARKRGTFPGTPDRTATREHCARSSVDPGRRITPGHRPVESHRCHRRLQRLAKRRPSDRSRVRHRRSESVRALAFRL